MLRAAASLWPLVQQAGGGAALGAAAGQALGAAASLQAHRGFNFVPYVIESTGRGGKRALQAVLAPGKQCVCTTSTNPSA